ncbi:MAG: hypothetical protein WD638_03150, partial [Nitriliruptoraceae bacterium]
MSARTARRNDDASTPQAGGSEHEVGPGEEPDIDPDEGDVDLAADDDLDDPFLDGDDLDESALAEDLDTSETEASSGEDEDDDSSEDLDETIAAEDQGDEEEETTGIAVVPPDAEFDDDAPVAPVDDEEEIEGVRDGEFVCRSC